LSFKSSHIGIAVCVSITPVAQSLISGSCVLSHSVTGKRRKVLWNHHHLPLEGDTAAGVQRLLTSLMSQHRLVFHSVPPSTHYLFMSHHTHHDHPRCQSAKPLPSTCMQLAVSMQERLALIVSKMTYNLLSAMLNLTLTYSDNAPTLAVISIKSSVATF